MAKAIPRIFRVIKPYPGLEVDDCVTIDRSAPTPVMLWRALAEEDVAGAEVAGCLEVVRRGEGGFNLNEGKEAE